MVGTLRDCSSLSFFTSSISFLIITRLSLLVWKFASRPPEGGPLLGNSSFLLSEDGIEKCVREGDGDPPSSFVLDYWWTPFTVALDIDVPLEVIDGGIPTLEVFYH
jgi:hypothetical protein